MIQQSQKVQPFTASYGSRGHMMLQAALGQENRIKKCDIQTGQVRLLNFKKKIRRKSVNFKDPVVQSEHIYHQTNFSSEKSNDLPPSSIDVPIIRLKPRNLKRKRCDEYEVNRKSNSKVGGDECLFSSPKVAKIIPYYQDNISETSSEKDKVQLSTVLSQLDNQEEEQPVEPTLPKQIDQQKKQEPPATSNPEELKRDESMEISLEPNDKFERSISNFFFNPAKWIMNFIYQ